MSVYMVCYSAEGYHYIVDSCGQRFGEFQSYEDANAFLQELFKTNTLGDYFPSRSPYWLDGGLSIHRPDYLSVRGPEPSLWRCDYCRSVNAEDRFECRNCGAPRFTYKDFICR